jgi:uncharacterized membrane protein
MSRLLQLLRGPSGHPLHPPLTDGAIGSFSTATVLVIVGAAGWIEDAAGKGAWLALVVGLAFSAGAAVTGLAELLALDPRTPVFRTALQHLCAMVTAVVLFGLAAVFQFYGFHDGEVTTSGLVLTLVGFVTLTLGGWLGGTIVFVHGMRVMSQPGRSVRSAIGVRHGALDREGADRDAEVRRLRRSRLIHR